MFRHAGPAWYVRALVIAAFGAATLVAVNPLAVAAEASEDDEELEAVQVTGTRIQSPNVTSANPISSITGEDMRRLGVVNVADAITQLVPQNLSTYQPTMTGDNQSGSGGAGVESLDRSSYFIGQTIANLRGMDGVFGSRTLTLIDGRRSVSTSNQADVVDMNIIPSNMLSRMDVVTGGASSTYGSGAMAGVVNMVLDSRRSGVSLDMDYGVNEAGDGGSPHVSISGGTSLFGGRGHLLLGGEWQDTSAIRNCAAARAWCGESRTLFTNSTNIGSDPAGLLTPLPGYEMMPARFEMSNVRYNQYSPNGVIYSNTSLNTVGYEFSDDGSNASGNPYPYGFRGGVGLNSSVMNGDGPLLTSQTVLRPSSERKTFLANFEFDFTDRLTGYLQGNYAQTEGVNKNVPTTGTYCARFNAAGTSGTNAPAGTVWNFSTTTAGLVNNLPYIGLTRSSQLTMAPTSIPEAVRMFLNMPSGANNVQLGNGFNGTNTVIEAARRGVAFPFWIPVALSPNPPTFNFGGNAVGRWVRYKFQVYNAPQTATNNYTAEFPNDYWLLETVTLTKPFESGTDVVLPQDGRNAYAFLNNLAPDALVKVQQAFNNSITAGSGAGAAILYGGTACNGYTAIKKVWEPQFTSYTGNEVETMRFLGGLKGRYGADWRWDAYFQYGKTDSSSYRTNTATNLRLAWAMDAVIDDRVTLADGSPNPTRGQPVCRVTRDGVPVLDTQSRPLTATDSLKALGAACAPLNVFGSSFSDPVDAARQQAAIAYAFVDTSSSGENSLSTLSISTNGTLWEGFGAGPLSGAFGLEVREDKVANAGTAGDYYLRADLASSWADAFGGKTRVAEGYTEFDLPLLAGHDGLNLFSLNLGGRYATYYNKGGEGTAVDEDGKRLDATQNVFNWKVAALFEPFDFVRFRVTRSRDLRAATYRDLFLFQPGVPDELTVTNPWRERSVTSNENQIERYGKVRVGNATLKPEKSDTLTIGMVLSPGGWAQGMRMSIDYYDITVKDGINVPFNATNLVRTCFENSAYTDPVTGQVTPNHDPNYETGDPGERRGFNLNSPSCQELRFAEMQDANGDPIPGTRNLEDLQSYNADRPQNSLPVWRRGIDADISYNFPLSRVFENLPGSVALSLRANRALEARAVRQEYTLSPTGFANANPDACGAAYERSDPQNNTPGYVGNTYYPNGLIVNRYTCVDMVGQIRSSTFIPGAAASPKWTGNLTGTYMLGDLTTSLSARYIGGARFDNTFCDTADDCANYRDSDGRFLNGSIDNNWVKPYVNFSLNGSYNLNVANMKQFQVFGSIANLFDKTPPFTGGGISGATANFHDTMGRAYRMGVRLKF
jgi:outer membrane receptor protein involved in Fe transport